MSATVFIVSLGPGSDQLITSRSLLSLSRAEVIFCPGTPTHSKAYQQLRRLSIDEKKIVCYPLPMKADRRLACEAYREVAQRLQALSQEGREAAVVAEGDAGLYSSTAYLEQLLQQSGIPTERIAGIPAFIAAAAWAGVPLSLGQEQLCIYPGKVNYEMLYRVATGQEVAVIMKPSLCEKQIKGWLSQGHDVMWHYFEQVETPQAFYSASTQEILERKFPYFSLFILVSTKRNR